MEPTVNIREINDDITNPVILCRVVRHWDIINYNTQTCRNMRFLLVDSENYAIEAQISKNDYYFLPIKPSDCEVYLFKNFRVADAHDDYNATGHRSIIKMHRYTQVMKMKETKQEIPLYYFKFRELEEIGHSVKTPKMVIDVIGCLSAIGEAQPIKPGSDIITRDILLTNERSTSIRITLWSEYIEAIDVEAAKELSKTNPVIIAISSLEVKHYDGMYSLKTFSATKIYTDPAQPHIAAYSQRFEQNRSPIKSLDPLIFEPSKPSKRTIPIPKTLLELLELEPYSSKDQQYICEATVSDILNKESWTYTACPTCKSSLATHMCERCGMEIKSPIQWYRIVVRVTQALSTAIFILMGKQAEEATGVKANVLSQIAQRTNEMMPLQLKNLIGKRFRFTVELNLTQLHNNRISFNVNHIEPITTIDITSKKLPRNPASNSKSSGKEICSNYIDGSPSNAANKHTGLSPQTAHMSINPDYMSTQVVSSSSEQSKRRRPMPVKQKESQDSSTSDYDNLSSDEITSAKTSKINAH